MPQGERELPDGSLVHGVVVADGAGEGVTVRCDGLTTRAWVGVDDSDSVTVGAVAAFFVPLSLGAAGVFYVVGRASARRPR